MASRGLRIGGRPAFGGAARSLPCCSSSGLPHLHSLHTRTHRFSRRGRKWPRRHRRNRRHLGNPYSGVSPPGVRRDHHDGHQRGPPRNQTESSRLTTIRHGGHPLCRPGANRMKKRSNRGVLNGTNDRMLNGTPSEGGVFQESLKRCSQPLSAIFLIPLWLSPVNRPARVERGRKAGTRAPPPEGVLKEGTRTYENGGTPVGKNPLFPRPA